MRKQSVDDRRHRFARAGEPAIAIVRKVRTERAHHLVDHAAAWPGVERTHGREVPAGRNHRHVSDPAEILESAPPLGMSKKKRIGDWHERRALSSRCHITHAKIAYHVDSGPLRNHRCFARLPSGMSGFVPDRLAMRSDRGDVLLRHSRFAHRHDCRLRKPSTEIEVEPAVLRRRALCQRAREPLALIARVVGSRERKQLAGDPPAVLLVKTRDRGGDAVQRRTGHEPDDNHSVTGGGASGMARRITPPARASAASASSRDTPSFCITIAVLTLLFAASRSSRASARDTPQTSTTMRSLRSLSLLLVAFRSTIRFP